MKNLITYLKALWSRVADSQSNDVSLDCRLTVVRPSFDRRSTLQKMVAILMLVFSIGVGNVWGTTATYTLDVSDNNTSQTVGSTTWDIGSGAIGQNDKKTLIKLVGTITVTLPSGATLNSVTINKGSTWGGSARVQFKSGSTTLNTFSSNGTFNLSTNKTDEVYTFSYSGSGNAWVSSIAVDYTAGAGCSYAVTLSYNGDAASHGEFVLKAGSAAGSTISEGGTVANCGSGTTVVALCPQNVDDHYHLEASNITATNKTGSITSDGNGNFLISYTQGGNVSSSVSVTFTEDTKYTVTWMSNGSQHTTTQVYSGEKPTFPSNPSSCDATSDTFYGWSTAEWSGAQDDVSAKTIYTDASAMPAVTGAVTYYAVFAQAVKSDNYQMLYDVNNFISGEDYLIDCYYSSTDHVLKAANYNSLSYQQVSYNSWTLPSKNTNFAMTDANFIWKITSEGNGHYSMYNATTGKYLVLVTVSSYKNLILSDTKDASFIRTVDTDGDDTYKFESTSVSGYYIYCNGSYYKAENEGDWLYLYKRVTTYSKYITNCCTELGTINGSITLSNADCSAGQLKATWKTNSTGLSGIASQTVKVYRTDNDNEVTGLTGLTGKTAQTTNQTVTISGLEPCTEYYVKIWNVSAGGSNCESGFAGDKSSNVAAASYTVTKTGVTNVTSASLTAIPATTCANGFGPITITAVDGYSLPSSISVTNATSSWDQSTGALSISSVTGDVSITITPTAGSTWKFKYSGDSYDPHTMDESAGVASYSISLAADTRYEFGFDDNGSAFYKNNGTIITTTSGWVFDSGLGTSNCKIHTGPAGTYTFAINTTSKAVTVTYPNVTHPNEHYVYFKNSDVWGTVYGHLYNTGNDNKAAAWPGSVMQATTTICGQTYHYAALNAMSGTYNAIKFNNGSGGYGNETSALSTTGSLGKYNANRDDAWHDFKYTVSYDKGTGESGSMSSHTELCPGSNQALSANTFTNDHYHFTGWIANVDVTINSETVTAGTLITGTPTLQNIQSDITLTAQWEVNSNTLTWDWNGGSTTSTTHTAAGSVAYGTTITYPANNTMSKSGYAFAGWSSSPGTMPDNNLTITAQWNPQVTWMAGGEVFNTQSGTAGTALNNPGTPSNSTYCDGVKVFVGWSASEIDGTTNTEPGDLFTSVAGKTIPAGGTTYYAVFATSSGGGTSTTDVIVDREATEITATGYNSGAERTWTTSTIGFGGHYLATNNANTPSGAAARAYIVMQRSNGTLYNTSAFPGPITKVVVTQHAALGCNIYCGTSRLMAADNNSASQTPSGTQQSAPDAATSMTWNISADDNYTFFALKAYSGSSGTNYISSVTITYQTSSITYSGYATTCCQTWTPPTLSYSVPGGWKNGDNDINATIGSETTYGSVTWESSDASVLTVNSSGQIRAVGAGTATVTATWAGDGTHCSQSRTSAVITVNGNVAVSFNANGGSLGTTSQSIPYNTATNLTAFANLSGTAPNCKRFDHWNTANDNSGTSYTDGQSVTLTAGLTLYAIYSDITYAVSDGTMVGVGSHSYSANPITCGTTLTITCAADGEHKGNPTVTATGTHGTITVVSATSVTIANVTSAIAVSISYAEKADVTATWNVNNGSVTGGGTTTQKEGSTFTFPNVTSTDCGTFLGWTNAANSAYSSTIGTPTPFYTAGSTTTLNENTQFYAVYSKVSDDAVSATLYAHDGDVNSITNAGYTNTTVTATGISTTNTTNYKTKFDDVGDKVIFQLDGTPTSFSAAFQTPSSGTSGTSTIKLYESSSTSGPWTEITSTSITTSSTSALLSETSPAKFTQRIVKLEMTSKGYNMMCGDITIVGLRAPIVYSTNPGCVDWVLDAINVTTAPTKTTYDECEAFDPTGMAVTATMYENGNPSNTTTKDVAGYTLTPEQFLTPGNSIPVTISYTEKGVTRTTTQTVRVNDLSNYTITFHDGDGTTTWTQANHCDACDLDSRTGSLACGDYTFAGWSTSSTTYDDVSATITTWVSGSYTPTANTHLYAVYRKGAVPPAFAANCDGGTFTIYEANGNTHMAGRVNNTPRAYTTEYWNNDCLSCEGDDGTPFTFTKIAENTYKIQNSEGEYLRKYSSGNHPDFESTWYNEDNFKWIISAGTNGTWRFTSKAATDYALVKSGNYFDFQLASNVTSGSTYYDLELSPAAATIYQSNPNCASTYTITFNTHGGTFVQGNYAYATETTSGLSGTTSSKFPSATLGGCTFAGWKDGSVQEEVTSSSAEGDLSDAPYGLIAADADLSVSSNKTYHAVYHYYDEDLEFDPVNGGTYHMYATVSGTKHFCSGTPGTSYGTLTSTTDCDGVVDVVITPGTGANAGKYKINIGGYDVTPELSGTGLKRGTFWWNIAEVSDNLYHITADGAESGRSLNYYSTSSAFTHYKDNGAGNTNDISFGRCRQHHWTSEPVLVPMVVLNSNSNIMVTSTNGQTLRSTTMLTVTATHYGETTKIYLSANVTGVGFLKSDGTALSSDAGGSYLQTDESGELATSVYVTYAPTVTTDGVENVTITACDGHLPSPLSQTTRSAQVRHLPTKFIIAQKVGDDWYALPNNMGNNYTSSTAAVKLSSVNESTGVATFYSDVTDQFAYQLLASKGLDKKGMVFSSPAKSNNIIKANTTASTSTIGLYAQSGWNNGATPTAPYFEFTPATSDLVDYTLKNTFQNNYLGITSTNWGIGASANVRFFSIDQQPAPTITWQNDMLGSQHAQNSADNGVITLPSGTPLSCNEPSGLLTFDGWVTATWTGYKTTGFTKVVGGEAATSATTFYAVFKDANNRYYTQCPTIYSITYTPNGGTGSNYVVYTMNTTADAVTVETAGFEKSGSTFVGWTNPDDAEGTIITPGAGKITGLSGNITLNAVWIGTVSVTGTVRLTASAGEKVATGTTDVTISSTDLACATALRITYKDVTNDVTYGRTGSPTYTSSEFRLCNGSYGSADGSNISLAEVSGAYNQTFSITYEPNGGANTLDEYELKVEVLLKNTVLDTKTLSLYGRTLPANFAIAIKVGGSWYALPNNMSSSSKWDPIVLSVTEDANVLNWSAQGPSTAGYKMKDYTTNYSKLRFAANDATEYCLWAANGDADGIRNYSASSTDNNYAWAVTPDANFNAYTIANLANTRTALKIYEMKWCMYNSGGFSEIHFIPLTTVTPIDITVMEWGVDEIAVKAVANWSPSAITAQISGGEPSAVTKTSIGGDLYKLTGVGDLKGNPGESLALNVTDGGAKQAIIQIPFIIAPVSPATSETKTEADLADLLVTAGFTDTRTNARHITKNMDVVVRTGGTISSESSTAGAFKDLYIYPGGKADFTKNISIQNVYLRGGFSWLGGDYAHPQMNVASGKSIVGIGNTGNGIFYDLYLNSDIYYMMALPKAVAFSALTNEENGDDWDIWVKEYSGEGRTLSPKVSGWINPTGSGFERGKGYEIAIAPRNSRPYGILRFPLLKSSAWSDEATPFEPSITGWGCNSETVTDNNKGWNFVGNPFMTAYHNTAVLGTKMQTKTLVHHPGDPWNGKWDWSTDDVKYLTIPRYTEYEYDDVRALNTKLDAFYPFFIQATGDGTLSFSASNKSLKMPAMYSEKKEREVIIDFTLENPSGIIDVAGLTIGNQYSEAFDMDDKEKTIQNGNATLKVYTLVGEFRTAFNSLPEFVAAQSIPVGYIANEAGDYTFSLAEGISTDDVEHIWLTDHEVTPEYTTDLVDDTYSFRVMNVESNNTRFTLRIELKEENQTPTDIDNVQGADGQSTTVMKFLYRDKMYILRNGVLYDATGKKVSEINK